MAWINLPFIGGEEPSLYDNFIQFWKACRERAWMLGREFFPVGTDVNGGPHVWESGTITGAVDNNDGTSTITVAGKSWCLTGDNPWACASGTELAKYVPSAWKAGIGNADPIQAAAGDIVSWTADTLTLSIRLNDWVTSKQVPSLSFFVGLKVNIIGIGRPHWHEQWPAWPNDGRLTYGTMTGATTTSIRVSGTWWAVDTWIGKELMCRNTAGKYLRLTITGNTIDTSTTPPTGVITFASTSPAPTGDFAIIESGGRFLLGHEGCQPFAWYMGYWDSLYSHSPDDVLDLAPIPRFSSGLYSDGPDDTDCPDPTARTIYDTNLWSTYDNECDAPDDPKNPNVTKSLRYLQAWCEGVCSQFLPSGGAQGTSRAYAYAGYAPATWFSAFGCDSWSGTIGGTSVAVDTSDFEYGDGLPVTWAVKAADGGVVKSGSATLTAADSYAIGGFDAVDDAGRTLVVSPGWNRYFERGVRSFYDVTRWEPDADPDSEDGTGYIVPPREPNPGQTAGPGRYITIPASTHYITCNQTGYQSDSTLAKFAIADGHIARLAGQNWWDTTTQSAPNLFGNPPTPAVYLDRAFVGRRKDTTQWRINASRSGSTKVFSTRQLTDSGKNWWTIDFWGGTDGVLISHTGTATGGSATTLADTSKSTSAFWDRATYPAATYGRWVGHAIQVQNGVDSDGNPIWLTRLITAQSGTTLTWSEPLPFAVVASTPYRIREPDSILNRWKGRTLRVTPVASDGSTGAVITTTLDGSTDGVLFFPAITLPDGTVSLTYTIIDEDFGGIWKRVAGKWVAASGADAVRRGVTVPVNFHNNPFENWADIIKDHGRMCPGDSPIETMNQLYAGINLLIRTPKSGSWTDKSSDADASPAINSVHGFSLDHADGAPCDVDHYIKDFITSEWTGRTIASTVDGTEPQSSSFMDTNCTNCNGIAAAVASFYVINVVAGGGITHTAEYFDYGQIDSLDTLPATGGTDGAGGCLTDVTFNSDHSPVAYHAWTSFGSSSGGTGNEYSPKLGNIDQPEWPTLTETCDMGCGGVLGGRGSGGYYVADAIAVLTWAPTYA